jgi:hypothetical protein
MYLTFINSARKDRVDVSKSEIQNGEFFYRKLHAMTEQSIPEYRTSVSDPDLLNPDPNPGILLNLDPDPRCC